MIGFKLLLALAVLAAGLVGGLIPLRRRAHGGGLPFAGRGNAFAAGVFLGAGLVHMLPEANRAWQGLGWDYPMAFLLAASGFALMLLLEHVLLSESAHEAVHAPSAERFTHLAEHPGRSGRTVYAVMIALSGHSLLAGIALGAEPEVAGALVIFTAILAHKSTEGFALGVGLARHARTASRAWTLLSLFAVATPLGIAIGTALGQALEGPARTRFTAAFLALASGTFAYVATLDILRDEFHAPGGRLGKWLLVCLGIGLMGLLALFP